MDPGARACLGKTDPAQRAAILGSEATPQVAQDITQLLPELRAAHAPTPRHAAPHPPTVLRNEGDFWTIFYLDRSYRLKDVRGFHYIAYLLAHPNERFHVRELSVSVGGDSLPPATSDPSLHAEREDAPPILDSKAKADYRARLSKLRADLDEAERMNDTGRAERIRQELEFVNDELSAAVGLSGRDRKMSDQAERTRLRTGKAIRSALNGIRARCLARSSPHDLHPYRLLLRLPPRSEPADLLEVLSA